MKKYQYLLILFCTLFFSFHATAQLNTSYAQGSCDSVTYWYIWDYNVNYKTTIYWGDGTSSKDSVTIFTPLPKTGHSHKYTNHGNYNITSIIRYHNGTLMDSSSTNYSTFCSYVNINCYLDSNTNCSQDGNEPNLNAPVDIEIDSAGVIIDTLSVLGSYHFATIPGITYKFRPVNLYAGSFVSCPTSGVLTLTSPSPISTTHAGFAFQCSTSSQYDLGVKLTAMFRPVATSTVIIQAYNLGCGNQSGTLTLQLSNKYKYKGASTAPASVSGNTISWNVSNLSVTNTAIIYLYADTAVGANVQANDTICNTANITPSSGDVNTANNTTTQCDQVRASWDPNDKHVYPAGDIAPGTKLTYTINFENLGNDTAFNIYIMDTLSNRLDAASLQLLSSSHTISHIMHDGPSGQKAVRFEFKDIHLPDKNSPDFNKGFVQFSINVKNGLAPLTPISNRAGIYFDINPVVITNYAENRIKPVSINDVEISNQITVYPNPVTDVLTIQINNGGYDVLRLLNNMGQVVSQQNISGNTMNMNMANLPTGMYYLQLTGKENTITQKVEKH
jgi:uncharacterized repeat protein (TIGR01451 family)